MVLNLLILQPGKRKIMGKTTTTWQCLHYKTISNPNKALSDWLLRKVLRLKEGELATIEKLDILGIDSVLIQKEDEQNFSISIMNTNSYERFNTKFNN